jgi:hypothetical protein
MTGPAMSGGVRLQGERGFNYAPEDCLWCGRFFVTDAAVIAVYALGELLGVVCPDHLDETALRRYLDACKRYEQEL